MLFMKFKKTILFILLLTVVAGFAQIRIVVADFKNESDVLFLDSWERAVPEMLQSSLSRSDKITVLQRKKLDAVFDEQKLALSGFSEDSALVKQIGNLAAADVILSGSIYKTGEKYRIDVHLTRVKTTRVITEIAEAPDSKHLKEMMAILANNIEFQLTGEKKYIAKKVIADYPTVYFLGASGGLLLATAVFNGQYQTNLNKYNANTDINRFDSFYDQANTAHKLMILTGSLTAAALAGAVYCWIGNLTGGAVKAHPQKEIQLQPGVSWVPGEGGRVGVQIFF